MKKTVLVITWTFAILAVSFLFSCKNRIRDDEASGTIGKVSKYRKDQMTEQDILLRSDIMKDTAKLASIIQGLVIFNAYTSNLAISIDNRLLDMESIRGFDEQYDQFIGELTDFKDFLKNNNEVLMNTIYMLGDFYKDTISESSADVENNLRLFANYVQKMEEKDSVLTVMVNNLDTYIEANEQQIVDKAEIEKLKSIRDEMLIRVIQQAYVMNDPSALKSVASEVLYDVSNLNAVCNAEQLQNAVGVVILNTLSNSPIASYVIGDQGSLQSSGSASSNVEPGSGGALPPVSPPSDPNVAAYGPLVLRGLVIADQGFLNQLDQLGSNEFIGSVVNSLGGIVVGSAGVGSTGQLQESTFLNSDAVGSAVLSVQDFISNSATLSFIEPL